MQFEKNCKPPTCEYSIAREKCVKPNPFIQYKSNCTRNNIPFSTCILGYNANKKKASEKACDYYKEYLTHNDAKIKKLLKDGPKKVGRPKKVKEPKEPKKVKEPKEPKKVKEPKETKKVKEPKETKRRGRPRKTEVTPPPSVRKSSSSSKLPSSSSSSSIKQADAIKRLSSSTFNLSNSRASSYKSIKSVISPSSLLSSSKKLPSLSSLSSSTSKYHSLSSSKSNNQSFSQSTPKIRTRTPSNIEREIEEIQKENREIEENLRKLIKKNSSEVKKDIGKFIKPLMRINRMTTIENRIKYYRILHKYINSRKKYEDNCLRLYKYTNSGNYIYRIGNRIILDKQIGMDSEYGSVFLSHYRLNNKKFGKLFTFATKISDGSSYKNQYEYLVLKDLTDCVLKQECPHFPISFGKLECKKQTIKDINIKYMSDKSPSFKLQNSSSFANLLDNLPKNIYNTPHIMITMNELADNDSEHFINLYHTNDKLIWNALIQIMISIMFFHKYTNAHHRDTHSGNFLYHKITPGGYFHYNLYGKDFYLENLGFLWVIWDFGLIQPFSNSRQINNNKYGLGDPNIVIIKDYYKFIASAFMHKRNEHYIIDTNEFGRDMTEFIYILYDELLKPQFNTTDLNVLPDLDKEIIRILVNFPYAHNTLRTEILTDAYIINENKPYII